MTCVQKVRETFEKMPEVGAVDIKFDTKVAVVDTKPGQTLTRDAVEKAFAGSTYGVTTFSASN